MTTRATDADGREDATTTDLPADADDCRDAPSGDVAALRREATV
jgi:hypothetical protein